MCVISLQFLNLRKFHLCKLFIKLKTDHLCKNVVIKGSFKSLPFTLLSPKMYFYFYMKFFFSQNFFSYPFHDNYSDLYSQQKKMLENKENVFISFQYYFQNNVIEKTDFYEK